MKEAGVECNNPPSLFKNQAAYDAVVAEMFDAIVAEANLRIVSKLVNEALLRAKLRYHLDDYDEEVYDRADLSVLQNKWGEHKRRLDTIKRNNAGALTKNRVKIMYDTYTRNYIDIPVDPNTSNASVQKLK